MSKKVKVHRSKYKCCFIENDHEIDYDSKEYFLEKTGKPVEKIFNIIITDASEKPAQDVWKAVVEHDVIWIDTCFIGYSGVLFAKMLHMAVEYKLKNKVIVNMFPYSYVVWHITEEHWKCINELEKNHKIKFVYDNDDEYEKYLNKL